jgi:tetratricopeptide (TPR) repeat protein
LNWKRRYEEQRTIPGSKQASRKAFDHQAACIGIGPAVRIPDLLLAPAVWADESRPQALFNRGNYMMEEENFAEAIAIFRQIEENGHTSGPLFYNMGISYLYTDSLGLASYYFHRSKAFRESADRARDGVATVERLMRTRGTFIPQLPWYAFFDWFLFHMHHVAWIVWGLVLINLGVLILLAGWLYRPDRRIAIAGMALAAIGIVQVVVTISIFVWADGYGQGVVLENGIPIKPSPDLVVDEDMSPDLAYEAYTVTLDKRLSRQHDGWVHIRLRNGVSGWIPDSAIRKL